MLATAPTVRPINHQAAVLTPRGDAAVTLHRFVRQLRTLDALDRSWILDLFREELHELPVTA